MLVPCLPPNFYNNLTVLLGVVLILVAGTFILLVARYGSAMQDWTDDHTEHA